MGQFRIAINALASSRPKSGIGQYTLNLVRHLSKLDRKNQYIVFTGAEGSDDYAGLGSQIRRVKLGFWSRSRLIRLGWEQTLLPFQLKKMGADLLLSPAFVSPLMLPCKSIITVHDMTLFTHPQYYRKDLTVYYQTMVPRSVGKADHILAVSRSTKADIQNVLRTDARRISVTPLGAHERFYPLQTRREKAVLFVGTLQPRKNLPGLIRAFEKTPPEFELWLAGSQGWQFGSIRTAIQSSSARARIKLLGYIQDEELPALYHRAAVFVYPSFYEGFGIPVLEAMASGCPVITSNTSSLKEIAEGAAELINPHDAEELAARIGKVIDSPELRQELSANGLKRAALYSWRVTAQTTLAAIHAVLNEGPQFAKEDSQA